MELSKEAKRKIFRAMPGKIRAAVKAGGIVTAIIRRDKPLHRWGNEARITIDRNGKLLQNSLIECAWNWDETKAAKEAAGAVDYLVYGDDYKVSFELA